MFWMKKAKREISQIEALASDASAGSASGPHDPLGAYVDRSFTQMSVAAFIL